MDVGAKGTQIVGKGSREAGKIDGVGTPPGEHASAGNHRSMGGLSSEDDPLWVQCNKCQKWRRLPLGTDPASVTSDWSCDVYTFQPTRARCRYRFAQHRQVREDRRPFVVEKVAPFEKGCSR